MLTRQTGNLDPLKEDRRGREMLKTYEWSFFGDILNVRWNGNVWISPCNGQQHSRREDAVREECGHYLMACVASVEANEAAIIEAIEAVDLAGVDDDKEA